MPVRNSRCSADVAIRLMEIAGTARISTLKRGDAAPGRLVYSRTKNRSEGGTRATDESFSRYITACADGSSRITSDRLAQGPEPFEHEQRDEGRGRRLVATPPGEHDQPGRQGRGQEERQRSRVQLHGKPGLGDEPIHLQLTSRHRSDPLARPRRAAIVVIVVIDQG